MRSQRVHAKWQAQRSWISCSLYRWVLSPWVRFWFCFGCRSLTYSSSQVRFLQVPPLSIPVWHAYLLQAHEAWDARRPEVSLHCCDFTPLAWFSIFMYRKVSLDASSMLKKSTTMKVDMEAVEQAAKKALAEREAGLATASDLEWWRLLLTYTAVLLFLIIWKFCSYFLRDWVHP